MVGDLQPSRIANLLKQKGFASAEEVNAFSPATLKFVRGSISAPADASGGDADLRAIDGHERLVIYGDYDVDGVTSLALLKEMLSAYGASPALFLPSRMEEGYGLSLKRSNVAGKEIVRSCSSRSIAGRPPAVKSPIWARAGQRSLFLTITRRKVRSPIVLPS
jgi:hypothetical protein